MTYEERCGEARAKALALLDRQMARLNRRRFDYRTARKLAGAFLQAHPTHGGHIRAMTVDVLLMKRGYTAGMSRRSDVELTEDWR
jgi:hypothetical protein